MTRGTISTAACLYITFVAYQTAQAQCEPGWSRQFIPSWPDGQIYSVVNYDRDGDGPDSESVIFGGDFVSARGVTVNHVAEWNGTAWSALGGGLSGLGNSTSALVNNLLVFDADGPGLERPQLWATGSFSIDGSHLSRLAKWDGQQWSEMIPPATGTIGPICAHADEAGTPAVFAAIQSGGIATVWKYTDGLWTQLGDGLICGTSGAAIAAMQFFDEDGAGPNPARLFVAGGLISTTTASTVTIPMIARWNQSWERVGDKVFGTRIDALQVYDADGPGSGQAVLVAVGSSASGGSGPTTCQCIDAWNGTTWTSIGSLYDSSTSVGAFTMVSFDADGGGPMLPRLWLSGRFRSIVGQIDNASGMAWWDGLNWHSGDSQNYNGGGRLFAVDWPSGDVASPRLIQCRIASAYGVNAMGNGENWGSATAGFPLTNIYPPSPSYPPTPAFDNSMIAAGLFRFGFDTTAYPAAEWDGFEWKRLGGDSAQGVGMTIVRHDPDGLGLTPPTILLMGTIRVAPTLQWTDQVVRLMGDTWIPLPDASQVIQPDVDSAFYVLDLDGPGPDPSEIYATGYISGGATPGYGIALWNGQTFVPIPGRFPQVPSCLVVHDEDGDGPFPPSLFAGGVNSVDGIFVKGIARWDGQNWSPLVNALTGTVGLSGTQYSVRTLCTYDPDGSGPQRAVLCAGGQFTTVDGVALNNVAQWDGMRWLPFGAGFGYYVNSLIVYDDDGSGPRPGTLYAGGELKASAGQPMKGCARWNGAAWEAMGSDFSGTAIRLFTMLDAENPSLPPSLWAIGSFKLLGVSTNQNIARWGVPVPYYYSWPRSTSVEFGQRSVLRVAVGGNGQFAYQWRRDGQPLEDGWPISGAATDELVIESFTYNDSGRYDCVVTNACGRATSPPADVRICLGPPTGDQNGDGAVNGRDIQPFVARVLSAATDAAAICAVDFTGNHAVDAADVTAMIALLLGN